MNIVLDAMGSDAHPGPEIEAAILAAEKWGDPLLLCGPQALLEPLLARHAGRTANVRIIDAPEVLTMEDKPVEAAKTKPRNSMAVGMALIKAGEADAFVTAGNTGGALANSLFRLGRIRGVKRPVLAAVIPRRNGYVVALDIGANADCRPQFLAQFAILGSIYAQTALGIEKPRVGLLSNGEEAGKGNELVKESYPLLEDSAIHFIGNVEAKEVFGGELDVVVCDGFTGNIFVKTSEAVAGFLIEMIREQIKASPIASIGGLLARPAFRRVGAILDPGEYGAAPLLGVDGLVFIGHGRSDARALVNGIGLARKSVENGLLARLRASVSAQLDD